MEASDLSEMENSVEKKRKSSQSALCNNYNSKNKIAKKLHLGINSRCVDKKKISKEPKISIPQYDSSSSKSSICEIGKMYTVYTIVITYLLKLN